VGRHAAVLALDPSPGVQQVRLNLNLLYRTSRKLLPQSQFAWLNFLPPQSQFGVGRYLRGSVFLSVVTDKLIHLGRGTLVCLIGQNKKEEQVVSVHNS
jgi:hypothetical protein